MTFKTYEINVDLVHDTSTTCSNRFSQNDRNSAKLLITITNKGAELDLSQAKSVRMSFKKPDGTRVFQNDCQPINAMKGKYQIVLKTQTLTSVGNVIAQIHIEEEDRIIDTQKFFFVVNDSLASDEAIESTNEFTIIQKAIEAGKKLDGVDINGIIAAGELAKGALPKSGGTMTGHLHFAEPYGVYFRDATNTAIATLYQNAGKLILRDIKNSSTLLDYDFATKLLNINAAGNVMKTTGGVLTGNLEFDVGTTEKRIFVKSGAEHFGYLFNSKATGVYNWRADKFAISYNAETDTFNVGASNTNLLKTTGGTMTGNLTIDSPSSGGLRLHQGGKNVTGLFTKNNTGDIRSTYLYDFQKDITALEYRPDTGFVFNADTNLLKNTGGTLTGDLAINSATSGGMQFLRAGKRVAGWRTRTGNNKEWFYMYDYVADNIALDYNKDDGFIFNAPTNLLKKTGDTMTGALNLASTSYLKTGTSLVFEPPTSSPNDPNWRVLNDTTGIAFIPSKTPGGSDWDWNKAIRVGGTRQNIVTKEKDGRATLTLTADGALISPNPIIADRKGNTVTVRAGIKRLSATSNVTLFTLPDTMRPLVTVQHGVISSDGTPATATIQANGDFSLQNAGSNIATNKDYFITLSYVVD